MRKTLLASAIFISMAGLAFANPFPKFSALNVGGSTSAGSQSASSEGSMGFGIAGNATSGSAFANTATTVGNGGIVSSSNAGSSTWSLGGSFGGALQQAGSEALGLGASSGSFRNMKLGNEFPY